MSKNKLSKFADLATYPNVLQPAEAHQAPPTSFSLKGQWAEQHFHNQNPIVLELGCGKGEYSVGLARLFPNKNFIGVDIKGARMWTGATQALQEGLSNVVFLRTRIEFIDNFFAHNEVSEIWLTFSDPQMKKPTKRLTSTYFLERYRRFLKSNGLVHVKTDSNFLFTYTGLLLKRNDIAPLLHTNDLYNNHPDIMSQEMLTILNIKTYYEQQWLSRGISIKYTCFELPHHLELKEPEEEIELDSYRSFARQKRSSLTKTK